MQRKELIERVKDYFDLNVYETKVWLALLSKGVASAGEVADLSGVPRSRTYDVLEGLEKRGFAIVKIGKPVKYLGVKPEVILEKLKNNAKVEADERLKSLAKIRETDEFIQLESLYTEGINPVRKEDLSAALQGRPNISSQLKDLLQNAKNDVIICTSADELLLKARLFETTFADLKKQGITITIALSGEKTFIERLEKRFDLPIISVDIDAKFFIIDKTEMLFYVAKDERGDDIAIWLNSDFFVHAFVALFEKATKKAK